MYLTFHNHGQYLLVPYGYEVEYPNDFKDLLSLAERAANQTEKYSYIVGNTAKTLYPSAGMNKIVQPFSKTLFIRI